MGGAWRYLLAQLVKHDAQQHGKTNKRLKSEISVMPTLRIKVPGSVFIAFFCTYQLRQKYTCCLVFCLFRLVKFVRRIFC